MRGEALRPPPAPSTRLFLHGPSHCYLFHQVPTYLRFFYEALPLCKYYLLVFNIYGNVTTAELLPTTVHYQVATTVSLFVLTTKYHYLLLLYSLQCITPFCSSMTSLKTISMHFIWQHDFCKRSLHAFFVERNPFWWPKKQRKKGPSECKPITHE